MSSSIAQAFYAFVLIVSLWLGLLWTYSRLRKSGPRPRARQIGFGVVTVLLLFVPIAGAPLWNRIFSYYPNPSLPMLGIVCAALWHRLFGLPVFRTGDWRAIWIFGFIAGSALYLNPLLLGSVDLYYSGWDRQVATWVLAGLAIAFVAFGNRLGVLFLAALMAYGIGALESRNCWDYVMDPFYWVISGSMLAASAMRASLRQFDRVRTGRRVLPATGDEEQVPVTVFDAATAAPAQVGERSV